MPVGVAIAMAIGRSLDGAEIFELGGGVRLDGCAAGAPVGRADFAVDLLKLNIQKEVGNHIEFDNNERHER